MVEYVTPSYQFPTRKPGLAPVRPLSINPHHASKSPYGPSSGSSSPYRQRSSASGASPASGYDSYPSPNMSQNQPQANYPIMPLKQRTDSSSTGKSGSSASMHLRRSGSTNTTSSTVVPATSNYVAMLRRQKATVWCERSQPEDVGMLEAQRTAKDKAAKEVIGSSSGGIAKGGNHGLGSGSSSSTSLRGVGRTHHHKLGKGSGNLGIGTGSLVNRPPPRLSATEANGDSDNEDDLYMVGGGVHRRSGSGRSSLNSHHRKPNNRTFTMYSNGNRDSSYGGGDLRRRASGGSLTSHSTNLSGGEPVEPQLQLPRLKSGSPPRFVSPHIAEESSTPGNTPGVRHANGYFDPPSFSTSPLPSRNRSALKRSGSVDEGEARTMTMSGLKLVVANPD